MRTGPGAYARAIEHCWSGAVGRPVVLSPREWALVSDWYERSIPLAIVEEAIQQTVVDKTRRGATTPRGLGYIAPAVEEAWSVVIDGRRVEVASSSSSAVPGDRAALARWRRRMAGEPAESPLRVLLHGLLEQYASGAVPEEIDRRLASELTAAVSEELLHSTRTEVERQLSGFRDRMEAGVFQATRGRAIVARLRWALDLPEIGHQDPAARRERAPSGYSD